METKLTFSNFWTHPRFLRHCLVWFIIAIFVIIQIITFTINNPSEPIIEDKIPFLLFVFGVLVLIYAAFFAYNKLQAQKKYLQLAIALILIITIVAYLNSLFGLKGIVIGSLTGFWANLVTYPFILIAAFGIKLAFHGGRQIFVIEKLKNKQIESELKLLKSQVNPHFLFNTLNNIYATNLEDHEKANEIILGLADLLRYQLKSQSHPMMLLSEEINILENYIALERIRVKDCQINVEKEGAFEDVKIVPLLLLPFVENAFKYGTGIESSEINIQFILTKKNVFTFYCRNKIIQKEGKVHSGGIGLNNVKKRLTLKYSNSYKLDLTSEDGFFTVLLKIDL